MKMPRPRPPSSRRVDRNGSPSQSSTSAEKPGPSSSITRVSPARTGCSVISTSLLAILDRVVDQVRQRVAQLGRERDLGLGHAFARLEIDPDLDPGPRELACDVLEHAGERARG